MYSVHQHWDPLKVCVVGRSYPPEFYSWIKVPHVRKLFEQIAIETEEDFQQIIRKLQSFGIDVLRPDLPTPSAAGNQFAPPPMTPRDYMGMFGDKFYETYSTNFCRSNYLDIADPSWPDCNSWDEFLQLPEYIQQECTEMFNFGSVQIARPEYASIIKHIKEQGNNVFSGRCYADTASCARIGKDLFWGTMPSDTNIVKRKKQILDEFPLYRNHIVDTQGHSDGTYCPVCPGLIISLHDVKCYNNTFPNWEVVYLPNQSWELVKPFLDLKKENKGKWWIPGFEYDNDVINLVETWLRHWTGYIEETVFDVNMLIVDPKNVLVFNYNKQVFDALERYSITPHIVPFRHRYFWDGGIHCITLDLHREGLMQDFFPDRG